MKLNIRVVGSGPPPIILHGLLGSSSNWISHGAVLGANFTVFLVDLRNHGDSPHTDEFSYDVMAAEVPEFIRDQNLGRIHLLGHSMGGKAAMRFAQLHPDLVRKLVVVDVSPCAYPIIHDEMLEAMLGLDLGSFRSRAEIDAALAAVVPDKVMRQFLLKNAGRNKAGALFWRPNLVAIRKSLPQLSGALPRPEHFDRPTLFIRGEKSDYIRGEDMALIRELFPHAILQTIPGAGHWVHANAPARFTETVIEFLSGEK